MSISATVEEALPRVLDVICSTMDWDWGAVWTVDPSARVLREAFDWAKDFERTQAFSAASRETTFERGVGLPGRIWESGVPNWIAEVSVDDNFPRAPYALRTNLRSAFGFPIRVDGNVASILEFYSSHIQPPDDELLAVMGAIGNQISQFIERSRAIESMRQSQARGRAILEASIDAIVSIDHTGRITQFNPAAQAMFGYSHNEAIGRDIADLIIPAYLRQRHREGLANYLATGSGTLIGNRVELTAMRAGGSEFPIEITVTPILTGGPPAFSAFIRDITERRRRDEQAHFLAQAGELLTGSLDYEQTLASVARLTVPFFADWCIVDLIDTDGTVQRIATAHAAEGRQALLDEMVDRYPPDPMRPHPAIEVARTGVSRLIPDVSEELWAQIAQDDRHLQILHVLQPRSGLTVPLVARGRTLGAIEFIRSEPGWRFNQPDLSLGEEIGRRAALAVDNAQLHRSTEIALVNREESLALLETVLAAAPVGLAFWDRNLRYVRINQFLADINGLPPNDHLGKTVAEALPDLASSIEPLLKQVLETGIPLLDTEISGEVPTRPGFTRFWLASHYPVRTPDGHIIGVGGVITEITGRRQAEDRLRFLASASEIVSSSLDYEDTLRHVAKLAVPYLANWCVVYLQEEDGTIRRIAVEHAQADHVSVSQFMQNQVEIDRNASSGVPAVIRSGTSLLYPVATPEMLAADTTDPHRLLEVTGLLGNQSWMCVPLIVHGRAIGAISFLSDASIRTYDRDDLSLAEDIGRRAAVAVENARLYRAEQETRRYAERIADRTLQLQEVTSALSGALTRDEVTEVMVRRGVATLNASRALVALLTDDGEHVEIVRALGYPQHMQDDWGRHAMSQVTPPTEVIRTGKPLLLESFEARAARFPHLARERSAIGSGAVATVPLSVGSKTIGALALGFSEDRLFDDSDTAFLMALAQQSAQALDRARLYEEEHRNRAAAEEAREQAAEQATRLRVLAEASRAFAGASLDLQQVLDTITREVSLILGDYCAIFLVDEGDTTMSRASSHHPDEETLALAQESLEREPRRLDEPLIARILAEPTPIAIRNADSDEFRKQMPEAYQPYLRQVRPHCLMATALRIRGKSVGILFVARERTTRPYSASDQALFDDIADRAILTIENARLYRASQEAIRAREQFLSIASHELKTPLTSIKVSAQLLDRWFGNEEVDPNRTKRLSAQLRSEIDRLETLVADLLDASRIHQNRLDLRRETVNIAELARNVVSRFEYAPEKTALHRLVVDAPDDVVGEWDTARLDQVFTNLVSNALKYSPDGGEVRVTVRADSEHVVIAVSDEGIGLSEPEREHVFEPFARSDTARQHAGGTGLGLFITHEIVIRHGGSMHVESVPGEGSTFIATLPR